MEKLDQASPRSGREIFRFKQFEVDQTDCAMKINTDGVLLGAMAVGANGSAGAVKLEERAAIKQILGATTQVQEKETLRFLDIGTGTGVIALMLAQRFPPARIDAIEIDAPAAVRADRNFIQSPFSDRLRVYHTALVDFAPVDTYDLIVSNPPYFLDSLKNPNPRKQVARHADPDFFDQLLDRTQQWLKPAGSLQLILPSDVSDFVESRVSKSLSDVIENRTPTSSVLYATSKTAIYSFITDGRPIRILLTLRKASIQDRHLPLDPPASTENFVIYSDRGVYSQAYRQLLTDFFLAF